MPSLGSQQYYSPNVGGPSSVQIGTSTYDPMMFGGQQQAGAADVARYQGMGAAPSTGAQVNTDQSNASRGLEQQGLSSTQTAMNEMGGAQASTNDAMSLDRSAAMGQTPSAAEIYGGKLLDDSVNSQMGMAASARGGPAAIGAAQRSAAFTGAQTQQQGALGLSAQRATEMAQGRDAYLGAAGQAGAQAAGYGTLAGSYGNQAGTMRSQDAQGAQAQAGLDDAQAARNQQNQQYYEQLAFNTQKQQQDAALQQYQEGKASQVANRNANDKENEDAWGRVKDVAGAVAGAGFIFSDINAKDDVSGGGGSGMGGMMGGFNPMSALSAYAPKMMMSDSNTKYIVSDERAKKEAFSAGASFGVQVAKGQPVMSEQMPEYARPAEAFGPPSPPAGQGHVYAPSPKRGFETASSPSAVLTRPNEDPVAGANRAQEASAYTYKPGIAEKSGQTPGEVNVGPMAQTMASDPVASTAVKQDPGTGLYVLDSNKLSKLHSAGIGSLQKQVDDIHKRLGNLGGRR